jgi:hypothetical protein
MFLLNNFIRILNPEENEVSLLQEELGKELYRTVIEEDHGYFKNE